MVILFKGTQHIVAIQVNNFQTETAIEIQLVRATRVYGKV